MGAIGGEEGRDQEAFGFGFRGGEYGYGYGYSYDSLKEEDVYVESPASASTSSSGSRQLQYQCAVCSSPSSIRCSQCKAVRYWSFYKNIEFNKLTEVLQTFGTLQLNLDEDEITAINHWRKLHVDNPALFLLLFYANVKCQILHWRQGHKDECRPVSNLDQHSDVEAKSHLKAYKQEPNGSHLKSTEVEGRHSSESGDSSPEEDALLRSKHSATSNGKHDIVGRSLTETKSPKLNSSVVLHSSEHLDLTTSSESSVDHSASDSHSIHGDAQSKYSTSTSSSIDDSSKSSLTESSTPSSGFWEGAVLSTRSRIGSLDSTASSPSRNACDIKISDSQSTSYARPLIAGVGDQGSNSKKNLENPNQIIAEVRKPVNRAESRFEVKDETESRRSSASHYVTSNQVDVHDSRDKCTLPSGLPSSSPNKSHRGVEGSTSFLQMPKDRQKESSPARISGNISSTNGRHDIHNVKSAKIDSTQVVSACSAESSVPLPNAKNGLKSSVLKVVDQFRGSKPTRLNSPEDEYEGIGRYGNKGLFPYENFVKLHNWKNELRPFGLVNCGNSCYANAVLQCLPFTPPLTSYFLQGLHSKTCEKKGWCFMCEFESLVLKAKDGNSPLSPSNIISHLESIGSSLCNGREETAHGFLRYVIDTMQSICLKEAGVTAPGSFEEETSLVGLTFGGYLRSKIECMRCGGKSERQERMMDLTVEIDGDIGTLEEALKQFTHTETLDGENKYRCGRCKSYEKAKKKLKVLEAPNVLTIALERFQCPLSVVLQPGKFGKLNKTIKFPDILNLAPYMSGTSDKSPVYQLYGVVVHLDVMNAAFSGHYVCYVRNFQNKWYKVDCSVKSVELERVLSKGAYMLLYSRCSPRAPRIMSLTIPRDPRRSKQLTCKSRPDTRSPWDSSHGDSAGQTCNECSLSYSYKCQSE
ncbi:hypothetical protein RND71_027845 [Anisodus tanguticus]|uniref:USP domain-containing protein n=1 Tax=Anisodus tanguticus TaxID=243964 RepID=A0AAE1V242_9SOLA|nr:hypothetical protein RND71_027845 [Anisodus tanguticus]